MVHDFGSHKEDFFTRVFLVTGTWYLIDALFRFVLKIILGAEGRHRFLERVGLTDVSYLSSSLGRLFRVSRLLVRAKLFKMRFVIRPFSSDPFNMSWSLEREVTRCFLRLLRPGSVVIDVGANVGWYSLLASSRGAKVVAVEPDPENLSVLTRTSSLNANRFQVLPYAIGGHDGYASLFIDSHMGRHSLNQSPHRRPIDVPQRTLRSVLNQLGLASVDLVKLDTEGNEFDILHSSTPLLDIVRNWIVEIHDPARRSHADQFFRVQGYTTEWLDNNHIHATKPDHEISPNRTQLVS